MSSGAGMTGGLLRKAGTGPGRFTLPVMDAQTGESEINCHTMFVSVKMNYHIELNNFLKE